MAIQTTRKKVTFKRPFILKETPGVNPPGVYSVETRVDTVGLFSFRKAARTSTWIMIGRTPGVCGVPKAVRIDPQELSIAVQPVERGRRR